MSLYRHFKIGIFTENEMRCISYPGLIFHDCTTYLVLTRPDWRISLLENDITMCSQYMHAIHLQVRQLRFLGSVHIADIKWLPRYTGIYNLYNFTVLREIIYPFYILQETKSLFTLYGMPLPPKHQFIFKYQY